MQKYLETIASKQREQNIFGDPKRLKSFLMRNEDEFADVLVTIDGIRLKRSGHNSNLSITFVISAGTVKPLFCKKCQYNKEACDCSRNHQGFGDSFDNSAVWDCDYSKNHQRSADFKEDISAADVFCFKRRTYSLRHVLHRWCWYNFFCWTNSGMSDQSIMMIALETQKGMKALRMYKTKYHGCELCDGKTISEKVKPNWQYSESQPNLYCPAIWTNIGNLKATWVST